MIESIFKAGAAIIGAILAAKEATKEVKNVKNEYDKRHNSPKE
jgi:hypothetical protein